jgi:thymidylate synthase (FAD)
MGNKIILDHGIGEIELIRASGTDLDVVNAARISFSKRKTELDDADKKLNKYLVNNNHVSTMEHNYITFSVKCPKPLAVQWFRHKSWSFNERSLRYCESDDEFYTPQQVRRQHESSKQASVEGGFTGDDLEHIKNIYDNTYKLVYSAYTTLIDKGVAKEQARMILPFGFFTEFWATCNLRSFMHWYIARIDAHAQWEIQELAKAAMELIKDQYPETIQAILNKGGSK